jgi:hypothetical protein
MNWTHNTNWPISATRQTANYSAMLQTIIGQYKISITICAKSSTQDYKPRMLANVHTRIDCKLNTKSVSATWILDISMIPNRI